jgi:hypothetical protein
MGPLTRYLFLHVSRTLAEDALNTGPDPSAGDRIQAAITLQLVPAIGREHQGRGLYCSISHDVFSHTEAMGQACACTQMPENNIFRREGEPKLVSSPMR